MICDTIDVDFDFTTDTPYYWDEFWSKDKILGHAGNDPDIASKTLQKYHQALWSKELPNGQRMCLQTGNRANYLTWNGYVFGSDSILVTLRYRKNLELLRKVSETIPDYPKFMESVLRRFYTIGGTIIFPKHKNSINQKRGCTKEIGDRWDLTLECIRRFYNDQTSPLYEIFLVDKPFFDLFVDFKGYVDFFYLNDCVSKDYSKVDIWLGEGDFDENPMPGTVKEYRMLIDKQLLFLNARNERIKRSF